jgi:hypothetical protein
VTTADLRADPLLDRFAQAAARVGARTEAVPGGDHDVVVTELRRIVGPAPRCSQPRGLDSLGRRGRYGRRAGPRTDRNRHVTGPGGGRPTRRPTGSVSTATTPAIADAEVR